MKSHPISELMTNIRFRLNPCSFGLFQLYFSSFEAEIPNAIASFKRRKIFLFFYYTSSKWNYLIN